MIFHERLCVYHGDRINLAVHLCIRRNYYVCFSCSADRFHRQFCIGAAAAFRIFQPVSVQHFVSAHRANILFIPFVLPLIGNNVMSAGSFVPVVCFVKRPFRFKSMRAGRHRFRLMISAYGASVLYRTRLTAFRGNFHNAAVPLVRGFAGNSITIFSGTNVPMICFIACPIV